MELERFKRYLVYLPSPLFVHRRKTEVLVVMGHWLATGRDRTWPKVLTPILIFSTISSCLWFLLCTHLLNYVLYTRCCDTGFRLRTVSVHHKYTAKAHDEICQNLNARPLPQTYWIQICQSAWQNGESKTYGGHMIIFLRKCRTMNVLFLFPPAVWIPVPLYPHQHLGWSIFYISATCIIIAQHILLFAFYFMVWKYHNLVNQFSINGYSGDSNHLL